MFKDQKKDRLDSYKDKSETQQNNLQSDGPSSFFLWKAGLPNIALPRKKKKHLMMIAAYNKRVKDIQLIW